MSDHKRSNHSDVRPIAEGRGAVPLPGSPADFAEMLSLLPDADSSVPSTAEQDSTSQVIDSEPASPAQATQRPGSPARSAGRAVPTAPVRRNSQRPAHRPPAAHPASDNELPPGVEEVLFADSPPPRSAPARKPVAIPFHPHSHAPAVPNRQTIDTEEPTGQISGRTITQQIVDLLEQNGLAAKSQLRIEVHNGVVVAAGEVPTPYEKQLVAHFCRQVPGVDKFVDNMVVREARQRPEEESPRHSRRAARQPVEWRLPFRAWHAGAAAGVALLVWGAFSLGFGRGGPERLAVYPVTGSLVFEGQPAAGATIVLYPQDPSLSARPRATVESDGSIIVTTYEPGDGAPAGEYKATVEWRRPLEGQDVAGDDQPPPNVLPAAYASPGTTPVRLIVEEGENEFPVIQFAN